MTSKHALIIAAGAADERQESLDQRTPLEAARTPALDEIASIGRQGTVVTIPPGFSPSRDVATLTLLGYDIRFNYPGYAGIEALGRRVFLQRGEIAFRCNLITVDGGRIQDPTAGFVDTASAQSLIEALNAEFASRGVRFHAGVSYRALLVAPADWADFRCSPAHDIIGEPLAQHWPSGRGANELRDLMLAANEILQRHPVNRARLDAGKSPANGIWLWGQGVLPRLPRFRERFGLRGTALGGVDLMRGVAMLVGWPFLDVAGATGGLDTDYTAIGRAAVAALDDSDLVTVQIESPDEASHAGNLAAKLVALERIDREIVAPLLDKLRRLPRWSILFTSDVAAHVASRAHGTEAVPFCLAGSRHPADPDPRPFGESAANASDLHIEAGWDLMEFFLRS